ncbi:GNAT family N-acetyltransferase [Ramlibacter sp. PS3R-8]|uniref:GNAT family N-acetyltransferase n=1 Tax=Ramlibacter sp. PS3R-8 TaxID=3133437 RepID=UPI0030AD929E
MAGTDPNGPVQLLELLDAGVLAMLEDLVVQSGWNQTGDDWRVFGRYGGISVVRDSGDRIVASGAMLPMGAALQGGTVAWISMILVTPARRGQGLGRAVFEDSLRRAQALGHLPMLDATPQGEPLYRKFGFEPVWRLTRWRRGAVAARAPAPGPEVADLAALAALDAQALGFRRAGLLGELAGRPDSRCVRHAAAIGVVRAGRIAHQIGPVLAADEAHAAELVERMASGVEGPMMIDAADDSAGFGLALAAMGFERQRTFTRMALVGPGQRLPQGDQRLIHAVAGPEFA